MRGLILALAFMCASAPAFAQNVSLSAPEWATRLLGSDILPTNGGRAVLATDGVDLSVRVTISPYQGGVARVIRYDSGPQKNELALRRFTGHPTTGWLMWGGDMPIVTAPPETTRAEIEPLARAVANMPAVVLRRGGAQQTQPSICPNGERIFLEVFVDGRASSALRDCMDEAEAGQLARKLSDLAGSRDEDELIAAGRAELLAVDRAFSARLAANGQVAALTAYGAQSLRLRPSASARTPQSARVSARGDMGWTSGRLATGQSYVTVWARDYEGAWKIAADGSRTAN
ncbi:MAG: hypothetical protein ABW199_01560 [Caulobacterales bacterium]